MTMVNVEGSEQGTELSVPGGCLVCEGELRVRLTHGAVWGYCERCRWLTQAEVRMEKDGLHLSHGIPVLA